MYARSLLLRCAPTTLWKALAVFLHTGKTFFLCPHNIVHILMIQLCEISFLRLKKCFLRVVSHNLLSKSYFHVLTVFTRLSFFAQYFSDCLQPNNTDLCQDGQCA